MGPIHRLFRLGLGKPSIGEAVEWEVEHHLQEMTDHLVGQGWSVEDARREAERRFGDLDRQTKTMVDADRRRVMMRRQGEVWDGIVGGFRQALRGMRRSPGLTIGVVLILGLGIGVNGAMFGVIDRLLLRPPNDISRPQDVRRILRDGEFFGKHTVMAATTYPDVADLRTIPQFASVGACTSVRLLTLGSGEGARQVRAVLATHDFFTTLGVRPEIGRFFAPDEDQLDSPLTLVLSYEFWQSQFDGDPKVLGRTLEVAGQRVTVIGVAPPGFTGIDLSPVDVWLPAVPWRLAAGGGDATFYTSRHYWWLRAVVRVRKGADVKAAEARATALHVNSRAKAVAAGRFDGKARILAAPLIAARGPRASKESSVARWVAGVSLVVLLIVCANVANLLLAQGAGRKRELAVRLSLGVSRFRLVREMVLETLLLAMLGGGVALALSWWAGSLIRAVLIPDVLWTTSPVNGRMVAFTALITAAAGLLAGVGPALQSTRSDLARDLADRSRGVSRSKSRVRRTLTVAQAALSTVLLVGAGLFVLSLLETRRVDLGFQPDHLIQATLEFNGTQPDSVEANRLYAQAMDAVRRVPGVAGVAATDMLYQWATIEDITVPGLDSLPVRPMEGPFHYAVSPGYVRTMGMKLLHGRPLQATDAEKMPLVALVNETMARRLWPDRDALGACFHIKHAKECTTVVGIVADASREGLQDTPHLAYYLPLAQSGDTPAGMYIRTTRDPKAVAAAVAPVLRSFSPRVRFAAVKTFEELIDPQTHAWRLGATLFTAFGALALLVAAIGLYSLLAFDVAQRTREIGIRTALGARRAVVLRGVVGTGARLAVIGVALGIGASLVLAPQVRRLLFHVDGADPRVLAVVSVLLVGVSVAASVIPALRASRVDPMKALRAE